MVGIRIWLLLAAARAFAPSHRQARRASSTIRHGLLKNLDPILTAELLYTLRRAGHGDVIVVSPTASNEKSSRLEMQDIQPYRPWQVVDANFPAVEVASKTTTGELITLAGVDCPAALDAIASVCPIDLFVDDPLQFMCPSPGLARRRRPKRVVGPRSTLARAQELPALGQEVLDDAQAAVGKHCGAAWKPVDRFAFYEASRSAFAVVQCASPGPGRTAVLDVNSRVFRFGAAPLRMLHAAERRCRAGREGPRALAVRAGLRAGAGCSMMGPAGSCV